MDYPRVIHVGYDGIGSSSNSGLTLGSMFSRWPEERLRQLLLQDPQSTTRPFLVTPKSVAPVENAVGVAARSYRRLRPRQGPRPEWDGLNNSVRQHRRLTPRQQAMHALAALVDLSPVSLPAPVTARLRAFRPQVVHSLLGGIRSMRVSLAVARALDLPIVPHFMDDWVSKLYAQGQLAGAARWETERMVNAVLGRSPVLLTIGYDMAEEFAARFRRRCFTVGNCIDPARYGAARLDRPRSPIPVLRYVGGLHLERDRVLAEVARALTRTAPDAPRWRIEIFAPPSDRGRASRLAEAYPSVSYQGSLPPERVPTVLRGADALLFLESAAGQILDFTRLSISTKVPQYLASGRPILVLGPAGQSSVRALLKSANSLYAGDAPTPGQLAVSLSDLSAKAASGLLEDVSGADWFLGEFGQAATQERLRASLVTARESWISGARR